MNKTTAQIILGFDYGTKYIGVAVGQTATNSARPLCCLRVKNNIINWQEIAELINTWHPQQLIVGLPVDMDGKQQSITFAALDFCNELKNRFQLPIQQVDERLSTWQAKQLLPAKHGKYSSKELTEVNAMAAAILIECWLNEPKT